MVVGRSVVGLAVGDSGGSGAGDAEASCIDWDGCGNILAEAFEAVRL